MSFSLRSWATPLVVGSFLVLGVTGVLMFFHLNTGLGKGIHEWAGLVMVAGGIAHIVLNWRAFSCYFRRPLARIIMAAGAVVLGVSFISTDSTGGPESAIRVVMQGLGKARLEQVADLAGKNPEVLIAELAAAGIEAESVGQTVAALAGGDRLRQMQIVQAAFGGS